MVRRLASIGLPSFACLLLAAMSAAAGFGVDRADGASSSTVVGATILTSTQIDVSGCEPGVPDRTDFGTITPGTSNVTSDDCTVVWGSSNAASSLRVGQQDGFGSAMHRITDGALDAGFGTGGTAIFDVGGNDDAVAIERTTDARFLVGLSSDDDIGVLRFDASGALDMAYGGGDGFASVNVGAPAVVQGIAALPDGAALVLYRSPADDSCVVARFTSAGAHDTTWASGGFATAPIACEVDPFFGSGMEVDAEGRITMVGTTQAYDCNTALARLRADGTPDPTYGVTGVGYSEFDLAGGSCDQMFDMVLLDDGSVLAAGLTNGAVMESCVWRFDPDGDVDSSWGTSGCAFGNVDGVLITDIERLDDGRVLWAGLHAGADTIVGRITAAGTHDTTFAAPNGYRIINAGTNDGAFGVAVDGAGNAILAGVSDEDALAIRVTPTGALDPTFGTNGIVKTDLGSSISEGTTTTPIMREGGFIVAGVTGPDVLAIAYGGTPVSDFEDGVADWDDGANAFGACLHDRGVATADWVDSASCATTDAEWQPVPIHTGLTESQVAHLAGAGSATTTLRFGFRASSTQGAGRYVAPITFEVLAP